MVPMKQTSKKKFEVCWTNWILGGDLISIVEGKQTNTKMDVKEVKHRRKAFVRNSDGTYSTIELPEGFEYSAYRRQHKKRRNSGGTVGVDLKVDNQWEEVDNGAETDASVKGGDTTSGETEDEKVTIAKPKKIKNGHMDANADVFKSMKWCKKCKVPSAFGTEATMPDGAMKAYCARCDAEHWVRQNNSRTHARCEEIRAITEAEKLIAQYDKEQEKAGGDKEKVGDKADDGEKGDKEKNNGAAAIETKNKDKVEWKDAVNEAVEEIVEEKAIETDVETIVATTDDEKVITWTAEQDKTILDMKAAGSSWAVIAAAVDADREAIKERFRELQKIAPKAEAPKSVKTPKTTPTKAATVTEVIDGNFGADLFGELNQDDANILASLPDLLAATAPETEKEGDEKEAEGKQTKETKQVKDAGNKKKGIKKNNTQSAKSIDDSNANTNFPASPQLEPKTVNKKSNAPTTSAKSSPKPHHSVASKHPDPDNGEFHFGPRLYGKLKPDAVWSKDDCDLLEHLLERYDNEKWLHMQANFYNWTGRMIAAEFIERKFKADYGPDAFVDDEGEEN